MEWNDVIVSEDKGGERVVDAEGRGLCDDGPAVVALCVARTGNESQLTGDARNTAKHMIHDAGSRPPIRTTGSCIVRGGARVCLRDHLPLKRKERDKLSHSLPINMTDS